MAQWAFHCFDAVTAIRLGTIRMSSWTHEDRLNDSGSWSATIEPPEDVEGDRIIDAATIEGRTVIVAVRDGQPVYTGWIPPGGRDGYKLAGAGLLSHLDRRVINFDVGYADVDQFYMVANLISSTQDDEPGIGIDTSQVGLSGVLRTQSWFRYERKSVGEAIRQKSALINGFDFDVRTELDTGNLIRRVRCWYPRRGRPIANSNLIFRHGHNATVAEFGGLTSLVTETTALGAEINEVTRERLEYSDVAHDMLAAGWPIISHTLNLPDVSEIGTLQDHVDGHLRLHAVEAADEIVLDVDPTDATHPFGSWELGDDGQVIVQPARPPRYDTYVVSQAPAYLVPSTSPATSPDTADLTVSTDIIITAKVNKTVLASGLYETIASHVLDPTNYAWRFWFQGPGNGLYFGYSTTGAAANVIDHQLLSSGQIAAAFDDGADFYIGASVDLNNGAGNSVFQALTSSDGVTWGAIGPPALGAVITSFFNAATELRIGAQNGAQHVWSGGIEWVEMRTGLVAGAGTRKFRFIANEHTVGGTVWTGIDGRAYTISTTTAVVHPDPVLGLRTIDPGHWTPGFPDGLTQTRRVVAHKQTVDETGETLQVVTGRALEA